MSGISSADLKTIFLAFFGLMASLPQALSYASWAALTLSSGLMEIPSRMAAARDSSLVRPRILMTAPAMAVLTIGAARLPSLFLTAISVALIVRTLNCAVEREVLGPAVAVDDDRPARLEALGDVDGLDQGRVDDDDMVGRVDAALVVDGLVVDADEGDDRRAPPFDAELGIGLDPVALLGDGVGQDLGGDDGALTAAAVETDFDHVPLLPNFG